MSDYLFVYGTLRKSNGGRLHPLLQDRAEYIGIASMPGKLYEVKNYPGAITLSSGSPFSILGEVYCLLDQSHLLKTLDEYEECTEHFPAPHEYRRRKKTVTLTDRRLLTAWVYLFSHSVNGLEHIIHGDYLRYKQNRLHPHSQYR